MTKPVNILTTIEPALRAEWRAGIVPQPNGHLDAKTMIARVGPSPELLLAEALGGGTSPSGYVTTIVAHMRKHAQRRFANEDRTAWETDVVNLAQRGGSYGDWQSLCNREPSRRGANKAPGTKPVYNKQDAAQRIAGYEQFLCDLNVYLGERSRKKIAQLEAFIASIPDETPWEAEERRRAHEEQFRETCRHEALHAAVVMDRGGRVTELTVNRSNNTGQCFYVDLAPHWRPVVDVAGSLAHQRGRGLYEPGCESDREHFVAGVDAKLPPDLSSRDREYAIGAQMIDAEKHAEMIWDQRGLFIHHLTDWLSRKHRLLEHDIKELWNDCYEGVG